ncbi:MAG: DUF1015 family protein [Actinomycetota bacterium]
MPELRPFNGFRYSPGVSLKDVVCPPYDIISTEEQQRLHERDPHNAVRLELAQVKGGIDDRYTEARRTFELWSREGTLVQDADPSLYVYRQDFATDDGTRRRVAGVTGALVLEEFGDDSGVLPHERTMPGPIEDRLALLRALEMNVSPIYGIFRGGGGLGPFYDSLEHRPHQARFLDEQGILHRLWVITAPAELEMLAATIAAGPLVIADGHHRYETALAWHRERGDAPGGHDAIMCFCVDADDEDLVVLPYNRALKLEGDRGDVGRELRAAGGSTIDGAPEEALRSSKSDHPFVFVLPESNVLIGVGDAEVVEAVGPRAKAWRDLDVVALHEALLPRLFPEGIAELTFTRDPDEVARLVGEGWDAGVLLRALAAPQIVDVARSGERMPQKASYFWPKAITGLVFRSLR